MSDTNERQLRIAHYQEENERAIFREKDWTREWLWYGDKRWKEVDAKRYWHEIDCVSVLITLRKRWTGDISQQDRKEEEKSEKQSWSEL